MSGLPVPSLTATILPPVGKREPRDVVVHEGRNYERRIRQASLRRVAHGTHHCSSHNNRSLLCPDNAALAETKALLRAMRTK